MPGNSCLVQWTGLRAVVTLPGQIDVANAGQITEQLLSLINRGAAELIADMTATVSCDYAGADAVVRAYQQAAVRGTQLRLVVAAPVVRRVLAVNGLDRLIPIYPDLDAAVGEGTEFHDARAGPGMAALTPVVPEAAGLPWAADQADRPGELLDWVVSSIFDVAMILQAAADLPRDAAGMRITEALGRLEDVVREIRQQVFARPAPEGPSGLPGRPQPDPQERLAQTADRAASLQARLMQTAHELRLAAADTAALLEQRADLAGQPAQTDYPTRIKRWHAFADQAEEMAKRWQQRP
jgi:anti-anti-sigma factor